jgi:hypothetical protein
MVLGQCNETAEKPGVRTEPYWCLKEGLWYVFCGVALFDDERNIGTGELAAAASTRSFSSRLWIARSDIEQHAR